MTGQGSQQRHQPLQRAHSAGGRVVRCLHCGGRGSGVYVYGQAQRLGNGQTTVVRVSEERACAHCGGTGAVALGDGVATPQPRLGVR